MSSCNVRTIYDNLEYSSVNQGVIKWVKDPNDPKKEYALKIAGPMGILRTVEDIDSNTVSVEIWCQIIGNAVSGKKKITTSLDTISSANQIESLAKQGLDVNSKNKQDLISFFRASRENKPVCLIHKTLGFGRYKGNAYFKHYRTLGLQKLKNSSAESMYDGMFNIKPKGSFAGWKNIVEKHVLTHPSLELALILGFSASLVGYIGSDLGLESFLFHIFGDSSTGKTTACFVATASFGSPNTRDNGLITSWNTTANALYGKISNNYGIPIVFDECSLAKFNDFTSFIYSIGEGREKERMTVELELRAIRTWMTSVISTGEKSLFEGSKANTGLKARLIEFSNVQWTENAIQSESIKQGLGENFGHAWEPFVKKLLSFSVNQLQDQLEVKVQEASSMLPKSQITDRLAKKVGMLFLTMDLCEDALEFKLQKQAIKELIIKHVSTNIHTSDIAKKAYLDLMQYITINHQFFERKHAIGKINLDYRPDCSYYGRLTFSSNMPGDLVEVEVLTSKLSDILEGVYGYESTKTIIAEFKKRGWLDYESGKTYRKRRLNGINTRVYVIKVSIINTELGLNEIDVQKETSKLEFLNIDNESNLFDGIEDLNDLVPSRDNLDDFADFEIIEG